MSREMYFSDFEVFAHDWLFVARRQSDGRVVSVWNDPESVQDFVALEKPVLCGFNYRDYDAHILKAVLLDWTPEGIHNVSLTIVTSDDRSLVWALFNGAPWVELPPIIDLFHDVVPRKGLKAIEAAIGMDIVESGVSFDIDRPLTPEEREEVQGYCLHDVEATARLYDLRYDYVKAKSDLCELRGVDPLTMLQHTNARIVSEVLEAVRIPRLPDETYAVPADVDQSAIPENVIEYVKQWNTTNCTDKQAPAVEFVFHDCPTVVGLGGIHGAVPSYRETASDERCILIQDVGSFYPSLIINNGYMSRAVADQSAYKQFYDLRMTAKAQGDKATADAAKLVLNTTFGTMKDTYNKMFDPMQATRVCLSGQLYILDVIEQLYRAVPHGLTLIQLNTDGWIFSCRREDRQTVLDTVAAWSERTRLTVDTDEIEVIVQANVNNYVMRTVEGKVKAKGGIVAKYAGGDFKSNSMTIIDAAVVSLLLDNVPVADTIGACDDISRFQIIAKAGRTFSKVVHEEVVNPAERIYEIETQRCNRVYATTDPSHGGIFKVKTEGGAETGRQKIPLTPENCWIDNRNLWESTPIGLTTLDRSWYVALAESKAKEFITRTRQEKEQMSEVSETTNELQTPEVAVEAAPKPTRKKAEKKTETTTVEVHPILTFKQKLLALQVDMTETSTGVSFDKAVSNINHEYADTQQYKMWLAMLCSKNRLVFGLDMLGTEYLGVVMDNGKSQSFGIIATGSVIISDADTDAAVSYGINGFGVNVNPGFCLGVAQTNALRNFILNNYLLDNMGRDGDDVAMNGLGAAKSSAGGFVSAAQKADIKQSVMSDKAPEAQFATGMYATALRDIVFKAQAYKPGFGDKKILTHFDEDGTPTLGENGKSTILKTDATGAFSKAEEIIAAGEKSAKDAE